MKTLSELKRVHLIGIGGIGVSGIAQILHNRGIEISGSDLRSSAITRKLETAGARIQYGHDATNIDESVDLVVFTSAVNPDNPEILKAKELQIDMLSRSQMYGLIMKDFTNSIAIAGAHGKTTTTSMTAVVFEASDLDPTMLIGAEVPEIGGNAKVGNGDLFITEACEYRENFLDFHYTTAVILNIDEDHLDYFENLEHIVKAFAAFADQLPDNGHLILNNDDYNAKKILSHINPSSLITFGITNDSDYQAMNITYNDLGCPKYDVFYNGELLGKVELSIPGRHNIYNSLATIAIGHLHGLDFDGMRKALRAFKGAKRRFELKGTFNGAKIIDDYAHHPSEIKATLEAALKVQDRKVIVAFQPHTYTRTKELLNEFSMAFEHADQVLITDIYAAREVDDHSIHSLDLVKRLEENGVQVTYCDSFETAFGLLKDQLDPSHLFFTMGAGDIYKLGDMLIEHSKTGE